MPRLRFKTVSQPYVPGSTALIDLLHPVRTSAQLADSSHEINTVDKFTGRCVFDSTLGEPVWASGGGASDAWVRAGGDAVATTAELGDAADAINTVGKYAGKMVWDSTLGQPVWADGANATDTWSLSTGVVSTTPS